MTSRSAAVIVSFFLLCFLYLTKHHMPFRESISYVDANDVLSYLKISAVAPGFPTEKISFHFAQRFIPHYGVGLFARSLNMNLETSYIILNAIIIFLILYFSQKVIFKKSFDKNVSLLLFSILAISPFSFRLNVFVPGLLADLVFILGLALSLNGISDKSLIKIILGMIIATSGKQMSLLILPGILLNSFIAFKDIYGRIRTLFFCCLLIFIVFAFYKWLAYFSSGFAGDNFITNNALFAVIPWFFSDDFSLVLFGEHLARIFIPSIPFLGLLFLLTPKERLKIIFGWESLALLLMVLGPAAYAFLPGPVGQMGNQSRYIASAMLPMILFTINILPPFKLDLQKVDWAIITIILILFSYHHRYCIFPSTPTIFIGIHLISISALFFWIWHRKKILITQLDQ